MTDPHALPAKLPEAQLQEAVELRIFPEPKVLLANAETDFISVLQSEGQ